MLIIESFNPTLVIGFGGVIAFVLGAVMLFRGETPGYQLSPTVTGITAAMFVGLIVVVLSSLRRLRRAPVRVGGQAMRGLSAEILDWSGIEGHVFTQGERWRARGAEPFKPGEIVEIASITELTLAVRRPPTLTAGEGGVR
jgi:membrane-bound serine protease (ClpP class)